ncbi:MAG: FAD-dependent oxidoreductase [Caldilineaceae bacterium]
MTDVTVIGCGVSGLSSAIRLQEAGFSVRIVSRELPPHTTSDVAGAIWHPISAENLPNGLRWASECREELLRLVDDPTTGVQVIELLEPVEEGKEGMAWQAMLDDLRPAQEDELPLGYTGGFRYSVPLIETPIYMAYLVRRFQANGGEIQQALVDDLDSFAGAERLVVNCTGAWAGKLTGDNRVFPIRGQILRLPPQPHITHAFMSHGGPLGFTYIFPRSQDCLLGGTSEAGNWSVRPDDATSAAIRGRCTSVDPSLANAEVIDVRVGLRPGRDEVRLELEETVNGPVIHNYGHSGIGHTLAWGCANDVTRLAQKRFG